MSLYLIFRLLHIVSAIAFVGGILARQVVRGLAAKTTDVRAFAQFHQAAARIENVLVIPGNLAVIVFGVGLALTAGTPMLGFLQGGERNWLLVSILLLIVGLLSVPLIFVPRGKMFDAALAESLREGQFKPALRAAANDPVVHAAHVTELALVAAVLLLMVFRPF